MDTRKTRAVVLLSTLIDDGRMNLNLIEALKKQGMTEIDLFDVSLLDKKTVTALHSQIKDLEGRGLKVRRVITPGDYVWHIDAAKLKAFYDEYYTAKNAEKSKMAVPKGSTDASQQPSAMQRISDQQLAAIYKNLFQNHQELALLTNLDDQAQQSKIEFGAAFAAVSAVLNVPKKNRDENASTVIAKAVHARLIAKAILLIVTGSASYAPTLLIRHVLASRKEDNVEWVYIATAPKDTTHSSLTWLSDNLASCQIVRGESIKTYIKHLSGSKKAEATNGADAAVSPQRPLVAETASSQRPLVAETASSQRPLVAETASSQRPLVAETASSQQPVVAKTASSQQPVKALNGNNAHKAGVSVRNDGDASTSAKASDDVSSDVDILVVENIGTGTVLLPAGSVSSSFDLDRRVDKQGDHLDVAAKRPVWPYVFGAILAGLAIALLLAVVGTALIFTLGPASPFVLAAVALVAKTFLGTYVAAFAAAFTAPLAEATVMALTFGIAALSVALPLVAVSLWTVGSAIVKGIKNLFSSLSYGSSPEAQGYDPVSEINSHLQPDTSRVVRNKLAQAATPSAGNDSTRPTLDERSLSSSSSSPLLSESPNGSPRHAKLDGANLQRQSLLAGSSAGPDNPPVGAKQRVSSRGISSSHI